MSPANPSSTRSNVGAAVALLALLSVSTLAAAQPGLSDQGGSDFFGGPSAFGQPQPSGPSATTDQPYGAEPPLTQPRPAQPSLAQPPTEELATPASSATDAGAATQAVATYDTTTGTWLPTKDEYTTGWMPELEIPPALIDCTCNGKLPGPRCRVWRSYAKPTDPSINQRCLVCVKEPYLAFDTVEEKLHVVINRCFETTEPFKHEGCEGGHWYQAKGSTKLRKLHPCDATVPVKYLKPVVRYRDVYYYIECDKSGASRSAAAPSPNAVR